MGRSDVGSLALVGVKLSLVGTKVNFLRSQKRSEWTIFLVVIPLKNKFYK